MVIIKSVLFILLNLILYLCFGALILNRKNKGLSLPLCLITGYFVYYFLFFIVCMPYMIKYRPLNWLTKTWIPVLFAIMAISLILCGKKIIAALKELILYVKTNRVAALIIVTVILVQAVIVSITYNFTLDAAYYVANVSTSLQTNMINVYDPFTGAWQNHYEVRYFFATYSINDAVMCQFFNMEALVWTRVVMSSTVIILVNILYMKIAMFLFKGNVRKSAIMLTSMFIINILFASIFTPSYFLMTRTYEGKTIVGNLTVLFVFYIYMNLINDVDIDNPWLMTFLASIGSITISSSSNMLIPGELLLLYVPYLLIKKTIKPLPKLVLCILPGLLMLVVYVLYIEGFFVLYTYPTKVS